MTRFWIVVLVVSAVNAGLKASGPVILRGREPGPRALQIISLMPAALLIAIVLVDTLSTGRHLVVDARLGGLAAACVALALRWHLFLVVVAAAATTAGIRALA